MSDEYGAEFSAELPRIAVIGCGGTISSAGLSSLDVLDYPELGQKLKVVEVLTKFPETSLVANPLPIEFRSVGSSAFGPADWVKLRALLHNTAACHPDVAGFVILHGTATLEETAYFLNLTHHLVQPVVMVGAQRPVSALGSDAGMNLIAALRLAGDPSARGKGVLVVLNDEIHAARDVTKCSTYRLHAFRSADFGALGIIDGDGIHFRREPIQRRAPDTEFASLDRIELPRVDIVYSYAGADGALVEAALRVGARGIVSAGLAPGLPTPGERAALEQAVREGVTVVQCSRAGSGRVAPRHYLRDKGIIAGEDLTPQKARILLALTLGCNADKGAIERAFSTY
jgi:L-asparaginase